MSLTTTTQWTNRHGTLLLAVSLAPQEIGKRIAAARVARGWTQFTFAQEANVSLSTVARWEAGKLPPVRELMRVADVLGVETEQFVEPAPSDDDRISQLEARIQERLDRQAEAAEAQTVELREALAAATEKLLAALQPGRGEAQPPPEEPGKRARRRAG